jgi:hypothetical protein
MRLMKVTAILDHMLTCVDFSGRFGMIPYLLKGLERSNRVPVRGKMKDNLCSESYLGTKDYFCASLYYVGMRLMQRRTMMNPKDISKVLTKLLNIFVKCQLIL